MADRHFYPFEGGYFPRQVNLDGSVTFGSASAISSQDFTGGTFTSNGAGDFTLTLSDVFNTIKAVSVTYNVNSSTAVDLVPQIYSVSASSKVIKFKLLAGSTATAPGSGASCFVSVVAKNSGV